MIMKIENKIKQKQKPMKKLIFTLLVCMCVGQACKSQTWQENYDKALELYDKADYKNAIVLYEKALSFAEKEFGKKSKEYAANLNDLGICYNNLGIYAKAENSSSYLSL